MSPSWPFTNPRPPLVSLADVIAVLTETVDENRSGAAERVLAAAEESGLTIYHGWHGRLCLSEQGADALIGMRQARKQAAERAEQLRIAGQQAERESVIRTVGVVSWLDTPATRHLAVAEAQRRMAAEDPRR